MVPKENHPIPIAELKNPDHYQRVKVRIDEINNVTVPISDQDTLNDQFFHEFDRLRIIDAEILH